MVWWQELVKYTHANWQNVIPPVVGSLVGGAHWWHDCRYYGKSHGAQVVS